MRINYFFNQEIKNLAVNLQNTACDGSEPGEAIIAQTKTLQQECQERHSMFYWWPEHLGHTVMFILTSDVPHCNNEEPFDKEKYLFEKLFTEQPGIEALCHVLCFI